MSKILKKMKLLMGDLKVDKKKLYVKDRLYISNNDELKVCVLQHDYNPLEQGYPGHKSMFWSI